MHNTFQVRHFYANVTATVDSISVPIPRQGILVGAFLGANAFTAVDGTTFELSVRQRPSAIGGFTAGANDDVWAAMTIISIGTAPVTGPNHFGEWHPLQLSVVRGQTIYLVTTASGSMTVNAHYTLMFQWED